MEKVTDFYESYGYYSQPLWKNIYFKIFIILFFILLVGIIIFFVIKYINKKKERKLFSWEWAYLQLNKIDIKSCESKNDFKKFYFDITEVIKNYFQKRYDWNVLDKTDEELIHFLILHKFDLILVKDLKSVFDDAQFIKFADQEAFRPQAEKDLKFVFNLVEKTKVDVKLS
ncbi:MAG: hypothetical protein ABIF12_02700 [bacterium]